MSLNYVSLTLDLYDGQGNPVTQGTATLVPSTVLTDTADHEIIGLTPLVASFKVNGPPHFEQHVFRAFRAPQPTPRIMFSTRVTASKWRGFAQWRTRQR